MLFSSVMKRKHNCWACGIVVCSKCSNQKLLFEDNKNMRVCRLCHAAFTQLLTKSSSSPFGSVPSLLQVSASALSVLSGYLLLKTQASKPWTKRWFALHVDFVLYPFKSEFESMAMTATHVGLYGCGRWMHALELATKAALPHFTQVENENVQESQ